MALMRTTLHQYGLRIQILPLPLCVMCCALERPLVRESKDLFPTTPQNDFYEALFHEKSRCTSSILTARVDPTPISYGRRLNFCIEKALPIVR